MDKENEEYFSREGLLSEITAEDIEGGNSQGFSPRNIPENEAPRILQMSQSFFVADTCEDDESMIIPPTQEFLIPSTPPPNETSTKEENSSSNIQDDTTISNLDETCMLEAAKPAEPEALDESDMTQDLPELDETQQLLPSKEPLTSSKVSEKDTQEEDEWDLRFSETQETQELIGSAKIRESREKEESAKLQSSEDKPKSDNIDVKSNEPTQPTPVSTDPPKPPEITITIETVESDDEIEPSQSCLAEYQGDTYSAFRDQLTQLSIEPPTSHSTPDTTFNNNKEVLETTEAPVVPSPITSPDGTAMKAEFRDSHSSASAVEEKASEVSVLENIEAKDSSSADTEPCKKEDQSTIILEPEPTEVRQPILVEDTQPEEKIDPPCVEDKADEKKVNIVADTIELMSSVDDSVCEIPKVEEKVEFKVPEVMEISQEDDAKDSKSGIAPSKQPEANGSGLSSDDGAEKQKKDLPSVPETLPPIMLPPLTNSTISRLSRKPAFQRGRKFGPAPVPFEKKEKSKITCIDTFNDAKSLEKIFSKFGIVLHQEGTEAMLNLRPFEELKVKETLEFTIKDHKVFLEQHLQIGSPNSISPMSSCSSSGLMADISSSLSAKSAASTSQLDSSTGSSQEHKTSTQNSTCTVARPNFSNIFEGKKEEEKVEALPIAEEKKAEEKALTGRKGRGRKAAAAKPKATPPAKRKRGRAATKSKAEEAPNTSEVTAVSTDAEVRPRKTRRKKGESPTASTLDAPSVSGETVANCLQGIIIPGMRVMARWKDGYYYPGEVVSQEMEGKWSIRFEDNDLKVIPQDHLIKVAILEKGTSVFAKSQDDYYDPGIICGHFREGSNVGYEVELDDGVTKRYPRNSVILSTDQANLITPSRPATTTAAPTINLDNILDSIDGRRAKRKSFQSPEPKPVKKSPRITKTSPKFDPNIASSSSATEPDSFPTRRPTRKRKAAKAGALDIDQVLTKVKKNPKLLKDYAFLLTNAERKKPLTLALNSSDCDNTEDDDIVPFDKDKLVEYIKSSSGMILESFDDVQKCKRKYIYLLANTYLRTMKYIKCIAAGIPCIKHHWVTDCCFKGEILNDNSYTLPSGKSLITGQVVEWHGKSNVLKGIKISLVSEPENPFVFNWAPVLLAAKADFVQKWNLPTTKSGACLVVDVLITNPQCPVYILESAKKRKIPIVSSEWIIQSLIAGEQLPYNSHPKFDYDYKE
ncbi:hypothetical protein JTE90_027218 [Oedothorax gibbosus]|uniref:BRCT domain-containing protein n=1 Tax=Oedothorax gibbosus TaxID=931172 RepID=A0AAV6U300_9ARAC|nr:hypothetical protein JTE90_027218 [Oedothorax gibbosus]